MMNFSKTAFVILFLAILPMTFAVCGGDDSDDDDAAGPVADDTASDDTVADDATDDAADDTADDDVEAPLPVTATVLVDGAFASTEGIAFVPDGRLFVVGDESVHQVFADGTHTAIAELTHPIGMTGDGDGNLLVAEFGPTSGFDFGDYENDGSIIQVTPEGATETLATGIFDPNFITMRDDGSFLVSDDYTTDIFLVPAGGGTPTLFSNAVVSPNGMVYTQDAQTLFVCQTFKQAASIIPDNRVWWMEIGEDGSAGEVSLLTELPALSTPDGAVLDNKGRLYVAANLAGKIFRIDPLTAETVLVAEDMFAVASLAFGRGGDFPETSMYATQLYGGKVWKLDLGVRGAEIP